MRQSLYGSGRRRHTDNVRTALGHVYPTSKVLTAIPLTLSSALYYASSITKTIFCLGHVRTVSGRLRAVSGRLLAVMLFNASNACNARNTRKLHQRNDLPKEPLLITCLGKIGLQKCAEFTKMARRICKLHAMNFQFFCRKILTTLVMLL